MSESVLDLLKKANDMVNDMVKKGEDMIKKEKEKEELLIDRPVGTTIKVTEEEK